MIKGLIKTRILPSLIMGCLLIAMFSQCELMGTSIMDYIDDQTSLARVDSFRGIDQGDSSLAAAVNPEGLLVIPPASSYPGAQLYSPASSIRLELLNERNFQLLLPPPTLSDTTAADPSSVRATSSVAQADLRSLIFSIQGAELGHQYQGEVYMKSPDGLRDFPTYKLPTIYCLSYDVDPPEVEAGTSDADLTPLNGEVNTYVFPLASTDTTAIVNMYLPSGSRSRMSPPEGDSSIGPYSDPKTKRSGLRLEMSVSGWENGRVEEKNIQVTSESGMRDESYIIRIGKGMANGNDITGFSFELDGARYGVGAGSTANSGTIDPSHESVRIIVPNKSNLKKLSPLITVSDKAAVGPASGKEADFSSPQTYTVKSQSGVSKKWTVTVEKAPLVSMVISQGPTKTTFNLGESLDTAGLMVTVKDSFGISNTEAPWGAKYEGYDATTPGQQTITMTYKEMKATFTVTVQDNDRAITEFYFDIAGAKYGIGPADVTAGSGSNTVDPDGNSGSIAIKVPFGTDRSSLSPHIVHRGQSISPVSGAAQNFAAPVSYTVTANDGSTAIYEVTVTVAAINVFTIQMSGTERMYLVHDMPSAADWSGGVIATITAKDDLDVDHSPPLSFLDFSETSLNAPGTGTVIVKWMEGAAEIARTSYEVTVIGLSSFTLDGRTVTRDAGAYGQISEGATPDDPGVIRILVPSSPVLSGAPFTCVYSGSDLQTVPGGTSIASGTAGSWVATTTGLKLDCGGVIKNYTVTINTEAVASIEISGPAEADVVIKDGGGTVISSVDVYRSPDSLMGWLGSVVIKVTWPTGFSKVRFYIDSVMVKEANNAADATLTISAMDKNCDGTADEGFALQIHNLTVTVIKGGVPYSHIIPFKVEY